MDRKDVAARLDEIAQLLELSGAEPFRIRSYQNVARMLEGTDVDLADLAAGGRLTELKGIGKSMASKITTLIETGTLDDLESLRARVPAGLLDMLRVPDLGPRKVKLIHETLGIDNLDALEQAAREGRLADLSGFGAKSVARIIGGLEHLRANVGRYLLHHADRNVEAILAGFPELPKSNDTPVSVAGDVRRRCETVRRIDILVGAASADAYLDALCEMDDVERVDEKGERGANVTLSKGMPVHLHVVERDRYPFALLHLTGSEAHTAGLRAMAESKGLDFTESSLLANGTPIGCAGEADIYERLGLQEIPPELRENMGELEAYSAGNDVPVLVTADDILNGVVRIETSLNPIRLLDILHETERALGRDEEHRSGPRTIDFDILFVGQHIIHEAGLTVPHPRLHLRRFVLEPLVELDADWSHPVFHRSVKELLESLTETSRVKKLDIIPGTKYGSRPACSRPPA